MRKILFLFFCIVCAGSLFVMACQTDVPSAGRNVLNLYNSDPLTLDPAISYEMTSHGYISQLFSGLVRLDDNLEPAPDIARRWRISGDGRIYTFYLRKDVQFHDGRAVTAEDFKYSWQRACNPATGSQTAATFLGDIVGADEVIYGQSREISGVSVLDDYTLEVTIKAPRSYFLFMLAYPTTFVVDADNVQSGSEWWKSPNGTGPFKLKQWDEETLLVLERNELYYGKMAAVDSVSFSLWGGVPMRMYESGEIDVTGVSLTYIDRVTDTEGPFYDQLVSVPELSFYYIGFNTNEPPFDDVNIRRAFTMAIDKQTLSSLIFRDMTQPADGILPPGMPGYNEDLSGLGYDVAMAKRLIEESGYGDVAKLPKITVTTQGWGGSISRDLEAIIHGWRQNLGVEVEVRELEPERFLYHLKEEKDQMFFTGWIADYPHPHNFLDVLFRSGTDYNYGGYSNPEVDVLLDMAGKELDTELSMSLYQQAEQKLVEDAACIPLWFGKNYILIKPYINDYVLNPQGIVMLNEVSID